MKYWGASDFLKFAGSSCYSWSLQVLSGNGFFLPKNTRKSSSISSSLPWTSKSQRNRRDVASHHRSGEPLQVKHVWEEMLIMSQKLIFRLRGNLVSRKSTFPPFYSCFIQYFPCIKLQSKTQKNGKKVY